MGWSCNAKAGWVHQAWTDACVQQTNISNVFMANGTRYMFETSRTEHNDGAITGSVWRFLPNSEHCRRAGSFRIEGDGTVTRAPKWLKSRSPDKDAIDKRYNETYGGGLVAIGSNPPSFEII